MEDHFEQIESKLTNLLRNWDRDNQSEQLRAAKQLLLEAVEAGRYIVEPDKRRIVENLTREVGERVFRLSGEYPIIRLEAPLSVSIKSANRRTEEELVYLSNLVKRYEIGADKYVPLAGIAEVHTANGMDPDQSDPFMPPELERLEKHGFSAQREIRRVPVADLREAVVEYRRLVLLGEPGSGKTMTLWRLAYDLAQRALMDDAEPLPVFVPLGGYTGAESTAEYIQGHFGDLAPHLPAYLQRGRVVLLLDGLNEMPQKGYAERVGGIQRLLDDNEDAPVVVTCRTQDYAETLKLEKLEIKPLDPERQRAYLRRYLGDEDGEKLFWDLVGGQEYAEPWSVWQEAGGTWREFWTSKKMPESVYSRTTARQDRLWEELRRDNLPRLLALGANPYVLRMLKEVYSRSGELPQNRGKLFAAFVDTLLAREEKRCDPSLWPGAHALHRCLAELAFHMQTTGGPGTSVGREWALEHVGDGCDPEQALALAAGATLLELTGGRVQFVHQLIQEYFAAVAWRAKWEAGAGLGEQWPDGWLEQTGWEETAVLLAGTLPDMTAFLEDLLETNPPLAARCIAESGGARPGHAYIARVQERLVGIATGTEYSVTHRVLAGDALNHAGDPRTGVGLAEERLPDTDWRRIEGGEYVLGSSHDTGLEAYSDEWPQHLVTLPMFSISRYPVTNVQYQAFVDDGGYTGRWRHVWTEVGWQWRADNGVIGPSLFGGRFDLANHPVVGVSWYEAQAYCRWLSQLLAIEVVLPSEAQWESCAGGPNGLRYPWGNQAEGIPANYHAARVGTTSAVGVFPDGATASDVLDMAGNIWEWTSSLYRPYPYGISDGRDDPEAEGPRVTRGGSFGNTLDRLRCAARGKNSPDARDDNTGFRVVFEIR